MKAAILFLGCIVIAVVIFVFLNPTIYKMNKKQKKIFKDAMKSIDKLN